MSVLNCEQEVTISFNRADAQASIYTADPIWIRKIQCYAEENPQEYKITDRGYIDGKLVSIIAECPKRFVRLAGKDCHKNMSDEQRKALSKRMQEINRRRKENNNEKSDT